MGVSDISLAAGMYSNLLALKDTSVKIDRTQERLASGKKVNSALDNPTNFFASQAALNRAGDLSARKDGMSEAIQNGEAANAGLKAITSMIESAKGIANAAHSASTSERINLATQFNVILGQIDSLVGDSGYRGTNLLMNDNLNVNFNENGSSNLTISGVDATSGALGISRAEQQGNSYIAYPGAVWSPGTFNVGDSFQIGSMALDVAWSNLADSNPQNYRVTNSSGAIAKFTGLASIIPTFGSVVIAGSFSSGESITAEYYPNGVDQTTGLPISTSNTWTTDTEITASEKQLETAMNTLRSNSAALSSTLSVVTVRQNFTQQMINTLQTGSDNLTLADMNEEGANMLILQTRRNLGVTSLSLASQASQSVMKLFS